MWYLWAIFISIAIIGLATDFWAIKKQHVSHNCKISAYIVGAWITVASIFGVLIYFVLGHEAALKFFTGYIVELSLSVDNLFVFLSIFGYFRIVGEAQQKALTYGIIGAILMRMFFIFAGISLLNRFSWLMYVFGILLIISAFGMLKNNNKEEEQQTFLKKVKDFLRIKSSNDKLTFFVKSGTGWFATPLLACVISIELIDIVFAADSVPAVLAITRNPLIVVSSNIFAVIGLRSLYIYLIRLTSKFSMLKYGIAANLVFIGIKMILTDIYHISTVVSISVIVSVLAIAMILSCVKAKRQV